MGRLVVMVLGFGPEGPGSIPDATKDSPSVLGVHTHKIHCSKCPTIGRCQLTIGVVPGENFLPLSETYQNCGGEDKWSCHLSSRSRYWIPAIVKWASVIRSNIPLCLKPYIGLRFPKGTRQQQHKKINVENKLKDLEMKVSEIANDIISRARQNLT